MAIQENFDTGLDGRSALLGSTGIKEREIFMIQSLHSSEEIASKICYGFTGVVLSAALDRIARGDRFQGQLACNAGILREDTTDSSHKDEGGFLLLVIGPYQFQSMGPLRIQRLITPQFYRIAIRCDQFSGPSMGVGRVNLAFYSDPRFCEGDEFQLDALELSKIPMPSLYLEALAGTPVMNAKLQTLDHNITPRRGAGRSRLNGTFSNRPSCPRISMNLSCDKGLRVKFPAGSMQHALFHRTA